MDSNVPEVHKWSYRGILFDIQFIDLGYMFYVVLSKLSSGFHRGCPGMPLKNRVRPMGLGLGFLEMKTSTVERRKENLVASCGNLQSPTLR